MVSGADVDDAVRDGGRGGDAAAGGGRPLDRSGRGVARPHLAVGGTDVDDPVGHGRGRVHRVPRGDGPLDRSGGGVERVDLVVLGADVDDPAHDGGRGLDDAAGGGRPLDGSGGGVERVDLVVVGADVDDAARDRRRGVLRGATGEGGPLDRSGGGVERVDLPVEGADVDDAAHDRWRGLHRAGEGGRPLGAQRPDVGRADGALGLGAAVRRVGSELGPVDVATRRQECEHPEDREQLKALHVPTSADARTFSGQGSTRMRAWARNALTASGNGSDADRPGQPRRRVRVSPSRATRPSRCPLAGAATVKPSTPAAR